MSRIRGTGDNFDTALALEQSAGMLPAKACSTMKSRI